MKEYNVGKIVSYIRKNCERIDKIDIGIMEDWIGTSQRIYDKGELLIELPRDKKLFIRGVSGSAWGSPAMRVVMINGIVEVVKCYTDDGVSLPHSQMIEILKDCKARKIKHLGLDGRLYE